MKAPEVGADGEPRDLRPRTLRTSFAFRTAPLARGPRWVAGATRERVPALVLRRLAVPLPSFLTSVNQIGFDSYDFLVSALPTGRRGRALLWVIGARRDRAGRVVADPARTFAFPLAGAARGNALQVSQRDVNLTFSFGPVPQERFDLRWQLDRAGRSRPGASAYGEVTCGDVPTYGAALRFIGLCNARDTLTISGAFLTSPAEREAGTRPRRLRLDRLTLRRPTSTAAGRLTARLRGRPGGRLLSLLLVDERSGTPLPLDFKALTRQDGRRVTLALPPGTRLPARVRAYVIADLFPLAIRRL